MLWFLSPSFGFGAFASHALIFGCARAAADDSTGGFLRGLISFSADSISETLLLTVIFSCFQPIACELQVKKRRPN